MGPNWSDPDYPITPHFTMRDALWLTTWHRMASAGDGLDKDAQNALLTIFQKLEVVRDFLGRKIRVHVAFRPRRYNEEIGGAENSYHIARAEPDPNAGVVGAVKLCAAVDFDAYDPDDGTVADSCDYIRAVLEPKLEEWDLRMEDSPHADWIHLDNGLVVHSRFFRP